jgi:hypothetical protein
MEEKKTFSSEWQKRDLSSAMAGGDEEKWKR